MGEVVASLLLAATVAASGINGGGFNAQWAFTMSGFRSGLQSNPSSPTVWIDAVSTGSVNAATLRFSMTISALSNYLVVGIADESSDVSTVDWNGTAMTRRIFGKRGNGGNGGSYIYTLASPATGPGGVTIVCSSADTKVAGAVSLRNVGSLAWTASNAGESINVSATTLASSNGSVIVANLYSASGTTSTTPGPRQTEWWSSSIGPGANETRGAGSTQGGNGSPQVIGWLLNTSRRWAVMAVELKP